MNRQDLIETASSLNQTSTKAVNEYSDKSDILVTKLNKALLSLKNINDIVGVNNISMMKNNHSNHVRFIATIISKYDPEVFVDTLIWVFNTYINHGFQPAYWKEQMKYWRIILKDELTVEAYNEITPFYNWISANIDALVEVSLKK
jgi:hypothetical protein